METRDGAFAQLTNPRADSGQVTLMLVCGGQGQAVEFKLIDVDLPHHDLHCRQPVLHMLVQQPGPTSDYRVTVRPAEA